MTKRDYEEYVDSFIGTGMTPDRYQQLNEGPNIPLTSAEIANGWFRCWCEWDGLVMRAGDPEAEVCTCYSKEVPK